MAYDVGHKYPGEVSSGMARRAEIVRALINDPKVLLLDEPYRAMDSLTKSIMHEALLEVYDRTKVTIFFITHDLEEAIFLGDRVAIMTTGRTVLGRMVRPTQDPAQTNSQEERHSFSSIKNDGFPGWELSLRSL